MKRLVVNIATAAALSILCAVSINAAPTPVTHAVPAAPAMPAPVHVNVNTATAAQLMFLPGVGVAYAGRIVEYRTLHGQFRKVSDLLQVKGIGERKLAAVWPYVVLEGATTATGKIHTAKVKGGAK